MKTEELISALKKITNNFETAFDVSTLLGWTEEYDKEGRLITPNPNYRSGMAIIDGKRYYFTRHKWTVRIWDREADYMDFMNQKTDFIAEVDLTPKYLKEA